MTHQELKKRLSALEKKYYDEIHKEIEAVHEEFARTYPIQEGDKCKDCYGNTWFFKGIEFNGTDVFSDIHLFRLVRPRKNGQPSDTSELRWLSDDELTKI